MIQEYDFSHHLSPAAVPGALSFDIPSPVPPDSDHGAEAESCDQDMANNQKEIEVDSIETFKVAEENLKKDVDVSIVKVVLYCIE